MAVDSYAAVGGGEGHLIDDFYQRVAAEADDKRHSHFTEFFKEAVFEAVVTVRDDGLAAMNRFNHRLAFATSRHPWTRAKIRRVR